MEVEEDILSSGQEEERCPSLVQAKQTTALWHELARWPESPHRKQPQEPDFERLVRDRSLERSLEKEEMRAGWWRVKLPDGEESGGRDAAVRKDLGASLIGAGECQSENGSTGGTGGRRDDPSLIGPERRGDAG